MAELVEQGKVRYFGLSEAEPETIRRRMRFTRSLLSKPSIRCGAATSKRTSCRRAASSGSVRPLLPARARVPGRPVHLARRARRGRLPPSAAHGSRVRTLMVNLKACREGQRDRRGEGRHAGAARDRAGACTAATIPPYPRTKRRTYLEQNAGSVDVELTLGRPGAHRCGPSQSRGRALRRSRYGDREPVEAVTRARSRSNRFHNDACQAGVPLSAADPREHLGPTLRGP